MTRKITTAAEVLSDIIIQGLQEKKGNSITRMDLRNVNGAITDYFVICTGTSDRHVQALAESVEEVVRKDLQDKPISREGTQKGEWVLLDYVDVVVHIFLSDKRRFYDIEGLWGDAEFEEIEA
ncbi:MAG: ribosome silencing factor [Bacteroidota bacterium]